MRLKAGVLNDEQYFHIKFYTKRDLQNLCEAYEIQTLSKHSKEDMNNLLVSVIKQCDVMLTPHVFMSDHSDNDTNHMSPKVTEKVTYDINSRADKNTPKKGKCMGKGKGKGKRSSTSANKSKVKKQKANEAEEEKEDSNCCSVCSKEYDESPDWICCDSCDKWVHGHCVGIHTEQQWEVYNDDAVKYFCPFCK